MKKNKDKRELTLDNVTGWETDITDTRRDRSAFAAMRFKI